MRTYEEATAYLESIATEWHREGERVVFVIKPKPNPYPHAQPVCGERAAVAL